MGRWVPGQGRGYIFRLVEAQPIGTQLDCENPERLGRSYRTEGLMKRSVSAFIASFLAALVLPALCTSADDAPTIPAGSTLHLTLTTTLSTRTNQNGDPWAGKVVEPIIVGGQEVVPAGSMVEGRVSFVKRPGRARGVAEMRLTPEKITTPDGGMQYPISAGLEEAQGAEGAKVKGEEGTIKGPGKSKKGAAVDTGVGAGVGAGAGAIGAGGSGALYGAAIGAMAGGIHNVLKRHKDFVVPQGTELTFVINRNTTGKKVANPNP